MTKLSAELADLDFISTEPLAGCGCPAEKVESLITPVFRTYRDPVHLAARPRSKRSKV
jgi:hypothetical protein